MLQATVFRLTNSEGHFFIGVTTYPDLEVQLEKLKTLHRDDSPLAHFDRAGWDTVKIEEIHRVAVSSTNDLQTVRNQELKKHAKSPFCLNKRAGKWRAKKYDERRKEWRQTYVECQRCGNVVTRGSFLIHAQSKFCQSHKP